MAFPKLAESGLSADAAHYHIGVIRINVSGNFDCCTSMRYRHAS
jgi:hypothetical protein